MAYSKKVVEKFENTLNNPEAFKVGRFDPKETNVGTGMVGAPACGDVMNFRLSVSQRAILILSRMLNLKLMVVDQRLHLRVN